MSNLLSLKLTANLIRQDIIKMLAKAGSGHPAGALGIADLMTALYFKLLQCNPKNPDWEDRDRLILSCGHMCPALYAALARAGYFKLEELNTLRQINSRFQGHPHLGSLPGVENNGGPLGQGVSLAAGLALAAKRDKKNFRVICITSDGEQNEGQVWEAYLFASQHKLDNLTFILDCNEIQIDGYTKDVLNLEPLKEKYQAFGMKVLEMNSHNFEEIIKNYLKAKEMKGQPVMIIAHTTAGKDISFMENKPEWHGKPPSAEQAEVALSELEGLYEQIKGEKDYGTVPAYS